MADVGGYHFEYYDRTYSLIDSGGARVGAD